MGTRLWCDCRPWDTFTQFCDWGRDLTWPNLNCPPPPLRTRRTVAIFSWSTRWGLWLRHCTSSRKVASSIPDGVIFHWHIPPAALWSCGRLSLYYYLEGKGGRCVRLTYLLKVLKSGSLNILEPTGSVQDCRGIALPSNPADGHLLLT